MHLRKSVHDLKGHREKFEDGTYICLGSYGNDRNVASKMADAVARRYRYKVRLVEKMIRVMGEHGLVRKPLYYIWFKVIE
jgi:hypothetical protein